MLAHEVCKMGWEDFNLGLMEAFDFSIHAQNLVLRVFDSAGTALDDEWKKYIEEFKKEIGKAYAADESEGSIMSQERDWEEDLYRQRRQGIGALALDWLMCTLQGELHSAKKYLDSTHPPNPPYNGRDWLRRVSNEYQQRFRIDFDKGPVSLERIQELALARNAGIHRDHGNLETYLKTISKPAFVDDEDRFFVTRDALVLIIQNCQQFIEWVVAEIEKLRPRAKTGASE
jgi:hypothetical protein